MAVDFIERYELDIETCDELVDYFWSHKDEHSAGRTHGGLNPEAKESMDMTVFPPRVQKMAGQDEPPCFVKYRKHLSTCIGSYVDKFSYIKEGCSIGLTEPYNIQWYKKGGGFKIYHYERCGFFDRTVKRLLVFMTYLNTVPDGGTEFKYYNHIETAVKGKTIIWPADWTHTHRGQISNSHEKIIATGWITYLWDMPQ